MISFFEKYLTLIIGVCVGICVGFCVGWLWRYSSAKTGAKLDEAKLYKADTQKVISAADKLEGVKDERQATYRTVDKLVYKIVDRPVYKENCIDTEGEEIVNKALAGKPVKP